MDEKDLKIPQHVAIIMDGNGRWAKKKHRPRTFGHAKGAKVLEQTLEDADSLGVKYFTVYAFSTENWARPYEEVQIIMNLFRDYLISAVDKCNRNNVRCMVIGERTRLDADIIDAINNLEEKTKNNNEIFLSDCVDFDVYTEEDLADGANGNFPNGDEYYPSYYSRIPHALTEEETVFYKVAYLSSLTKQEFSYNDHAHFYGGQTKPTSVNVSRNRPIVFKGQNEVKTLQLYINVNYAVSELNKYASSIYSRNIHAVFDYAFELGISVGVLD